MWVMHADAADSLSVNRTNSCMLISVHVGRETRGKFATSSASLGATPDRIFGTTLGDFDLACDVTLSRVRAHAFSGASNYPATAAANKVYKAWCCAVLALENAASGLARNLSS